MKYDDKDKCPKCGEKNDITVKALDGGHVSDCVTKCTDESCGCLGYWSYGFYDTEPECTRGII